MDWRGQNELNRTNCRIVCCLCNTITELKKPNFEQAKLCLWSKKDWYRGIENERKRKSERERERERFDKRENLNLLHNDKIDSTRVFIIH